MSDIPQPTSASVDFEQEATNPGWTDLELPVEAEFDSFVVRQRWFLYTNLSGVVLANVFTLLSALSHNTLEAMVGGAYALCTSAALLLQLRRPMFNARWTLLSINLLWPPVFILVHRGQDLPFALPSMVILALALPLRWSAAGLGLSAVGGSLLLAPFVGWYASLVTAVSAASMSVVSLQLSASANRSFFRGARHKTWAHALDHLGNASVLEWNAATNISTFSPRLRSLLGLKGANEELRIGLGGLIHPDDRSTALESLMDRVREMRKVRTPYAISTLQIRRLRLLAQDGRMVSCRAVAMLVANGAGSLHFCRLAFVDSSHAAEGLGREVRRLRSQIEQQAEQIEKQQRAMQQNAQAREDVERIARHDLKTPLSTIIAAPSLLRRKRHFTWEEENLLSIIERSGRRVLDMLNLSEDLLRIEQGAFVLIPQPVDLLDLADRIVREMRIQADSKEVDLRLIRANTPLTVAGLEIFCHSIIENLLRNAIEAAPDRSVVTVSLFNGEWASLSVHNIGAVHPAVRDRFFDKYATHGKANGLGIGTYSARLMARALGGDLRMATSDTRDTTTLTLTLQRYAEPAQSLELQRPALVEWGIPVTASGPSSPVRSGQYQEFVQVLIVEDDEHNALVIATWLPPHFKVRHAVNGRAALDMVKEMRPDLILMDLEMPIMGGLEAHTKIRQLQAAAGQPASFIVAFSAHDTPEERKRLQAKGFDLFLPKPASAEALDLALEAFALRQLGVSRHAAHPF